MPPFPPGPGQLASFTGMFPGRDMRRIPLFFRSLSDRYGPVAGLRIGRRRFFIVSEPALIEDVLVTHGRSYVKGRGTQRLDRLLGRGLLTSNGVFHLRQRRLVQPAFHRERIAGYAAAMVRRADAFAATLTAGTRFDMGAAMARLTLDIAAETLFGTNVDADAATIGRALEEAMANFPLAVSPIGELVDHLPMLPPVRRFRAARAALDAVVYRLIDDRIQTGRTGGSDVLAMLLETPPGEQPMDIEQVRDEAMTILLAGHETTANAMTWAWWLLATHPAAAARLHAELDTVLGDRAPGVDDVPALTYARDVIAETLRLYPPAWVIGRRAIEETPLGEWTVPTDGIVITSQAVVHREPRFWHEPDAFRPERWSNGELAGQPKFAYFPFGGGNRVCIGEAFAWTEAVLILATIARRWRFAAAPGLTELETRPLVTLRPKTAVPLVPRVA